jgi:hypothetical protein
MKNTILVTFALLAIPAFAGNDKNYTYLALGDSVPFGMNILLVLPPFATQTPTPSEFVGYPETVAAAEHLLTSKKEVNASCPGESSGSFLDVNTIQRDYGCNFPHPLPGGGSIPAFRPTVGLKVAYQFPSQSQMEFAEAELASNKHIDKVTLSIGANDVFVCLSDPTCNLLSVLDPDPTTGSYAKNLNEILTRIRANYKGKLVLLMYYSPDPTQDVLAMAVNAVMKKVGSNPAFAPVQFADGFTAFKTASAFVGGDACKAGLLIPLPPGLPAPCDIHPSPLGRDLLAAIVEIALQQ